jgi:hypothetical protein
MIVSAACHADAVLLYPRSWATQPLLCWWLTLQNHCQMPPTHNAALPNEAPRTRRSYLYTMPKTRPNALLGALWNARLVADL